MKILPTKILIFSVASIIVIVTMTSWIIYLHRHTVNEALWKAKYPQLYNNAGFMKLATLPISKNMTLAESQQELIGPITNQFGLRDDILIYILDTIPENNVQGRIAAIKMAEYDQAQIGVNDSSKINDFANRMFAAISCMHLSLLDSSKFISGYDSLMRNSSLREAEQYRIEKLLSGHVISADYGINSYDKKEQCEHFLGVGQNE